MGIKIVKDVNNVPQLLKTLETLQEKKLNVGIISKETQMLLKVATAHEFGAHITAKKGKYLTIPLSKEFNHKSPRSIQGLFFFKSKKGNAFLARKKGKDNIELCYYLTTSVDIPERSFIRAGFDENKSNIEDRAKRLISQVLNGDLDIETFYDFIGNYCVGLIQEYMRDLSSPQLSNITIANKGSSNPLIDTGRLWHSISFEVI
ncbi:MAG: hypothetical protein ACTTHM_04605 [Peptoanaerobacter stomatis]|uniref:hypothetical protein n=1 Tax=Peptoanaerobacter stomatis TaxID=796937 RepID=UPI003FA0685E